MSMPHVGINQPCFAKYFKYETTYNNFCLGRIITGNKKFQIHLRTPQMPELAVKLILVRAVTVQVVRCSERSDHYFWYFGPSGAVQTVSSKAP